MAEELKGIWRLLTLTEEEKDNVKTEGLHGNEDLTAKKSWLVRKLLTNRLFNKDAMLGTLKIIWKLSEAEVTVLDDNLFLFKFVNGKDKQRVLEGSPWSFNKQLIVFKDYDGELCPAEYVFNKASFWIRVYGLPLKCLSQSVTERIGQKLGSLIRVNNDASRHGWNKGLGIVKIRVQLDITKPLRRFVTLAGGEGKDDLWGMLKYERLPSFCYGCGPLGHNEMECERNENKEDDTEIVKQYVVRLRASLLMKRNRDRKMENDRNLWGAKRK